MKGFKVYFFLLLAISCCFTFELDLGLHENDEADEEVGIGIEINDLSLHEPQAAEGELDPNTALPDLDKRVERLTKWANEHGVDTSKLYINTKAPLRGMYARVDIKKGEEIIKVPKGSALLINEDVVLAKDSPLVGLAEFNETLTHYIWGLWHLWQIDMGEKSVYKPYLDVLPINFTMPHIQCSSEELTELAKVDNTYLNFQQREKQNFEYYYAQFQKDFFPKYEWAFPEYKTAEFRERFWWSYNLIRSRTWHKLQVPFVDMFNHKPNTMLPDSSNGNFVFRADKDYKKDEEVFISYGPKDDASLWLTYGFVLLDNNAANCFNLQFDPRRAGGFYNSIAQAVKSTVQMRANDAYTAFVSAKLPYQDFKYTLQTPDLQGFCVKADKRDLDKLLHAIRYHYISTNDLAIYDQYIHTGYPVSLKTESKMLSMLHAQFYAEGVRIVNATNILREELSHLKGNFCYDNLQKIYATKENTMKVLVTLLKNKWMETLQTGMQSNFVLPESSDRYIPAVTFGSPNQVKTFSPSSN